MDSIDSLIARIKKTGYPLEIEISSLLDKRWDVINTDTYVDRDENKIKDIDIHASSYLFVNDQIDFTSHLTIECKKSDYLNWVFFTRPLEKDYMDVNGHYLDAEQRFCQRFNTITLLNLLLEPLQLHYWDSKRVAVCYKEFIKKADGETKEVKEELKRKPIFEAQNQVKKFIYDHILNGIKDEGYPCFVDFYFPCIAFDGNMFEAIVENGKISLKETNHIVLATSIPSISNHFYMKYLIDVVRKDFVRDYLKIIESDIQTLADRINTQCEKALNIIGRAGAEAQRKWAEEYEKNKESSLPDKESKPEKKSNSGESFDPDSLDWELRR
jgi:hypothetical protein